MSPNQNSAMTSSAVRPKVVVIGGGVTGLAAAYEVLSLSKGNAEVIVLEAMGRVGGTINTYDMGDLVIELGPDSFFTQKPVVVDLCKRLGIEDRLIWTNQQNRRTFIALEGKLWTLPEGFAMFGPTKWKPFFDSPLFTFGGKLRAMMDLALPKSRATEDESLSDFVRRRLGDEVLEKVVQPLVAGMYTADPDLLSVRAALPRLYELEQKYGSVTRGLMAETQKAGNNGGADETEGGPRYGLFASLDGGMSHLIDALIKALPLNTVKTQAYVLRVEPGKGDKRWHVICFDGTTIRADAVIVATPAFRAADVIQDLNSQVAEKLKSIQHASSIVVNAMFYRDDVPHPLDGFGFVVPRSEKRSILACSFSSNKFAGRAPKDKVLMRVFFGGALQPEVYDFADEHLQCLLWEDLHTYLGIKALPVFTMVTRHPHSMPQYHVGHGDLVQSIAKLMDKYEGIELAGNAYQGVGIPDCVLSGQKAAQKVVALIDTALKAAAPRREEPEPVVWTPTISPEAEPATAKGTNQDADQSGRGAVTETADGPSKTADVIGKTAVDVMAQVEETTQEVRSENVPQPLADLPLTQDEEEDFEIEDLSEATKVGKEEVPSKLEEEKASSPLKKTGKQGKALAEKEKESSTGKTPGKGRKDSSDKIEKIEKIDLGPKKESTGKKSGAGKKGPTAKKEKPSKKTDTGSSKGKKQDDASSGASGEGI